MFLQKIILKNVAPIGNLELTFDENQITVLSAINGKGKTTLLSYIADAFFEIARVAGFQDVFLDNTKYYRVTSPLNILGDESFSIVYIRFINQGKEIDYIEAVGSFNQEMYDEAIFLPKKINFSILEGEIKQRNSYKAAIVEQATAIEIFKKNIMTYFPHDRLEVPVWMNDIEYRKHRFNSKARFNNELGKNIEVRIISDEIVNWILDIVLDHKIYGKQTIGQQLNSILYIDNPIKSRATLILEMLNKLIKKILCQKLTDDEQKNCRFGVGQRDRGQARLSIVKTNSFGAIESFVPSIFHLSSGEISLLMLFAEIIKQYDTYPLDKNSLNLSEIAGVVLIDEIDKHLHIHLQQETLPELIALFPNLQFIVSSHSPFFALGISQAESLKSRIRLIELPVGNELSLDEYTEVKIAYEALMGTKLHQADIEKHLATEASKPAFFVEGRIDIDILNTAWEKLYPNVEMPFSLVSGHGKGYLNKLFSDEIYKTDEQRLFFGLFDFDEAYNNWNGLKKTKGWELIEVDDKKSLTLCCENAFLMLLPIPDFRKQYASQDLAGESRMTIEHLFTDKDLDGFYKIKNLPGGASIIEIINKNGFAEKIKSLDADSFLNFKPLFEKVSEIIRIHLK